MPQDHIVTCPQCTGKNRVPAGVAAHGARARCAHCGASLPLVESSGSDPSVVRTAILEPAPVQRRRGRWFLGFLMGSVATAIALYYVDRRTDLQTIQFDQIDLSALYDRYWPQLTALFRGELPTSDLPSEEPSEDVAAIPVEEPSIDLIQPVEISPQAPGSAEEPTPQIIYTPVEEPAPDSSPIPLQEANVEPLLSDDSVSADDSFLIEPAAPAAEALQLDPAPLAPPPVDLVAQPVEQGVLYNNTGRDALAPLNIVTDPDRDYFVKLIEVTTGENAMGIFVRGGSVAEFEVPLGSYEVRYASGLTWYGLGDLFGPETSYAKAAETFAFTEDADGYVGYTLTLIMQEGGNLDTLAIAPESF